MSGPVPVEHLRAVLDYDPETGSLKWRHRDVALFAGRSEATRRVVFDRWNRNFAGRAAGSPQSNGYWKVCVANRHYLAHRVIWAMQTGAWPSDEIDHINGDRADNRFANLREATRAENCRNIRLTSRNSSGVSGVSFDRANDKWQARIGRDGKTINLGNFKSRDEAAAAVQAARPSFGFSERHGADVGGV